MLTIVHMFYQLLSNPRQKPTGNCALFTKRKWRSHLLVHQTLSEKNLSSGYSLLALQLIQFDKLPFQLEKLNKGYEIETAVFKNLAKYHQSKDEVNLASGITFAELVMYIEGQINDR